MDRQHGKGQVLGNNGRPQHEPPHIRLGHECPAEWTVDRVGADLDSTRWTAELWHRGPPHRFSRGRVRIPSGPAPSRAEPSQLPANLVSYETSLLIRSLALIDAQQEKPSLLAG